MLFVSIEVLIKFLSVLAKDTNGISVKDNKDFFIIYSLLFLEIFEILSYAKKY
ncbi:hypothetical protein IMK15_06230 [Sneathia sp. DSM 16631]|nr:hypothetical protein [Sneathia sp. DSM 16631]